MLIRIMRHVILLLLIIILFFRREIMATWITKKDGKVDRIRQAGDDKTPGEGWVKVPEDWGGNPEDKLAWFDGNMRRIPDEDLVKSGKRKDERGRWYSKTTAGETKIIAGLDREAGEGWTREAPLEGEPYQKWDETSGSWIADAGAKEKAGKDQQIAGKKAAIEDAERRIQRSTRAKLNGTATQEDEDYFRQITAEIDSLREELKEITAA
jgi:hypothetical protein